MKFFEDYKTRFLARRAGKRNNLVIVALENFPSVLFRTAVGITLLGAPFMLNYFSEMGVEDLYVRILLNALVVVIVPALVLFIYALLKSPFLRSKHERDAILLQQDLRSQEDKDQREVERLRNIVMSDGIERQRKDAVEEKRWDSLNERLRIQEQTGLQNLERKAALDAIASAERINVAQRVKDIRDEAELARLDVASTDLIERQARDRKEDGRRVARDLMQDDRQQAQDIKDDLREARDLKEDDRREARDLVQSDRHTAQDLKEGLRDAKDLKEEDRRDARELVEDDRQTAQDLKEGLRDARDLKEDDRRDARELVEDDRQTAQDLKDDRRDARDVLEGDRRDARELLQDDRQTAQDLKDDKRWDRLTEGLRAEKVNAGKRSEELKTERDFLRQELATSVLTAQQVKSDSDDDRWKELHDRLKIQESRSEARDRASRIKDDMQRLMRSEDRLADQLRDQYRTLLDRYIRQATAKGLSDDVADGIAPIPKEWLLLQPEIVKDPTLLKLLAPHNER